MENTKDDSFEMIAPPGNNPLKLIKDKVNLINTKGYDALKAAEKHLESELMRYSDNKTFIFDSYSAPNTMFSIHNSLPELLLNQSMSAIRVYLKILTLLKRNHDPRYAHHCYVSL